MLTFQNDKEEYEYMLNHYLLSDAVLDEFGSEPIDEYGSYRQVDDWMRKRILNWLHSKDFYWDVIWGIDDYGDEESEDDDEEEEQPKGEVHVQVESVGKKNPDDMVVDKAAEVGEERHDEDVHQVEENQLDEKQKGNEMVSRKL